MTRCAIVASGKLETTLIADIRNADCIIGVDAGALWLLKHGVTLDVAIGDFDSVTEKEREFIKRSVRTVIEYPHTKDATDMELAVDHAMTLRPQEVVLYGAIGGRLDHTVGNIYLLERFFDKGVTGIIRDFNNDVRIVNGRLRIKKDSRYRYISILPITETIEVTLTGFAYDTSRAIIGRGKTRGMSNTIKEKGATIQVHRGKALVIRTRE